MIKAHKNELITKCKERLYTVDEVMPCVVEKNGDMWTIDVDHPAYPMEMKKGVGTELKKILSTIGIHATPNCSCTSRAVLMNSKGVDWCRKNKETIIDWLSEESKKRKLPFFRSLGRRLVDFAISRSVRS